MTPADFQTAFPAFKDVAVATVQRLITQALPYLNVDRFGQFYNEALGYLVAHFIVMEDWETRSRSDNTLKGGVVSEETANLKTAWSSEVVLAATRDPLLRTTFGQRFVRRAKFAGMGPIVP